MCVLWCGQAVIPLRNLKAASLAESKCYQLPAAQQLALFSCSQMVVSAATE